MASIRSFEQIVLSQQPAQTPWRPVTDYSFQARKAIEGKQPALILDHLVSCDDADILDWGCGPDAILVRLLRDEVARRDLQVAIEGYDPQRHEAPPAPEPVWDLVICREVLEHLTVRQIASTVSDLCVRSAQFVYVTTRFSSEFDILHVETSDDLDPTHISLCAKDLIRLLFVLEGFRQRKDLEQALDWQGKRRCLVYERAA